VFQDATAIERHEIEARRSYPPYLTAGNRFDSTSLRSTIRSFPQNICAPEEERRNSERSLRQPLDLAACRTSTPCCPPSTGSPPPACSAISVPYRPTRSSISSPSHSSTLPAITSHGTGTTRRGYEERFEVEDSDEWTAVMAEYNRKADAITAALFRAQGEPGLAHLYLTDRRGFDRRLERTSETSLSNWSTLLVTPLAA